MKSRDDHQTDHQLHAESMEPAEAIHRDLARWHPAAPSVALRQRIALELTAPAEAVKPRRSAPAGSVPGRVAWFAERILWAAGGALVAAVPLVFQAPPRPAALAGSVTASISPASGQPLRDPTVSPPVAVPDGSAGASAALGGLATEMLEPISEESLAWSDEGVQFLDGQIPARIIRHFVLERYPGAADGEGPVRSREDVFVVPVALR